MCTLTFIVSWLSSYIQIALYNVDLPMDITMHAPHIHVPVHVHGPLTPHLEVLTGGHSEEESIHSCP